MSDQAERIVEAMGEVHGVHSGFRAAHAKGVCAKGKFVPTSEGAEYCAAAHFHEEVPVTVRFSNGTGKPTRADGARDERGMAVKFHLPNGKTTDMVCLTIPVFFVRTPEDFLEMLAASRPDPDTGKPDIAQIESFIKGHPESQMAFGFSMFSMAPASYANCTFYAIHAFRLIAPDGTQRFVRYRWIPEAGEATLQDYETRELGKDYLWPELEKQLTSGRLNWDLYLQIGEDADDPTDPTVPWPEERRLVKAGRLTLDEFAGHECKDMIFDPARVTDGIETSEDQILHARSAAYSVSYARRTRSLTL
jgi:catalase